MNKQELLEKLTTLLQDEDTEGNHIVADELILNYINDEDIRKAYDLIGKWYS